MGISLQTVSYEKLLVFVLGQLLRRIFRQLGDPEFLFALVGYHCYGCPLFVCNVLVELGDDISGLCENFQQAESFVGLMLH